MAEFPTSVYSPRTKANKAGVVYDALKTKNIYAEDVSKLDAEVVAIETILGLNPSGDYDTVVEWLEALQAGGGAQNFGNCDGGTPVSNYGAIDPVDGGGV